MTTHVTPTHLPGVHAGSRGFLPDGLAGLVALVLGVLLLGFVLGTGVPAFTQAPDAFPVPRAQRAPVPLP